MFKHYSQISVSNQAGLMFLTFLGPNDLISLTSSGPTKIPLSVTIIHSPFGFSF